MDYPDAMNDEQIGQELKPPCVVSCPVNTDTRLLAQRISEGNYEEALEILLEANPFSSVCGRICHHPCEQSCRRVKVDASVSLRMLKRFVIENTRDYRKTRSRKPKSKTGKRVAIIGSGPAGLTVANDLAYEGHSVTVFEKSENLGGMLCLALPRYRLPYSVVEEDIRDIISLGVDVKTRCEVGKDVTISKLREDCDAVLIATGLAESRSIDIPGIDSEGVFLAIPFLTSVTLGQPLPIGKNVVVIGGGNVAIDVARTAVRLGAKKVAAVSLESREEMPAWDTEVREALEEEVEIINSRGPLAVISENRRVKGIEFKKCTSVFDEEGRFRPMFDEKNVMVIPADSIIIAIGQRVDLSLVEGSGLKTLPGGRLEFNPKTLSLSENGFFACGEVAFGPGSAVEAVQKGHVAARVIEHYLGTGTLLEVEDTEPLSIGDIPEETFKKIKERKRIEVELLPAQQRVKDFQEFERSYTEEEALREARRCLSCTAGAFVDETACASCLNCVRICPFGVATVEKTAIMPEEKCQTCGICAAECPAAAIALKRFQTSKMESEIVEFLEEARKKKDSPKRLIVSFACLFETTTRKTLYEGKQELLEQGIYLIPIPCVARLSLPELLAPLALGADSVVIIACESDECLYPGAEYLLHRRIKRAKSLLDEIGVSPEKIDFWITGESAETSWKAFLQISRMKADIIP
jgi:NADPH-dependent glutamate synthase beta subunit-like oxidoreductase/coenzyme F420-reducing hydrogenase delta subunit